MEGKKILVIDDDRLVRESIRKILKKAGFDPVLTPNASEALERARQEEFDLIVSDIKMPGMNGVQAVREIRRLFNENSRKDIPIVFITGYADLSKGLDAEQLGEVILKPFDLNHLVTIIREYL